MSGTLGERIREARVAKGLSVGQLSQRIGITEDALRKIESGNTQQPAFVVGLRIAAEVTVNPFFLGFGDVSYKTEESHRTVVEQRFAAVAFQELERLLMQISALCRLANSLEDQARGVLQRIAQGSP
ncbi:MAG: helix-turn-helix domain-containing protein [Candidatus Eremiobacteraeota bacterium]|nr:helix-turn-helix domain-containing protein [Candidatus Eremiobacteraeota bacterium]